MKKKRSITKPITTLTLLENQGAQRNNPELGGSGIRGPSVEDARLGSNYTNGIMYASPTADYINTRGNDWNQEVPMRSKTTMKKFYNTGSEF